FKISNGALKGETLPRRLKFFAWGDNKSTDGNFRAGERTSSELAANQKKYGFERVAIDFNHCSVPGTDTYKDLLKAGQPPLIFGYGRVEAVPNDGIYLEDIVWTPLGAQHARNFEDLSPAIRDEDGEVTLVHSVALTPNGKVQDLNFFTADPAMHEHRLQNAENKNTKMVSLTLLAAALGLPETAEEKTILEKLSQRLVTSTPTEMVTLSARIEALENALRKNSDEQQGAERQRIVTLLSTEGKAPLKADRTTYSREELLALDVPTLKLLHANTPVTVPLSARGMTSQMDGQGRFVSKDSQGNLRVDLAGIFNSENERNGQSAPKFA
ncbi:MAG TPA: phage protease, partial [Candidatus Acidoferrum sp.]|nr:phage protease [Candidatus Acidoferrum sp.]